MVAMVSNAGGFSLLVAFGVVALVVAIIIASRRRGGWGAWAGARRPRRRHLVTRIVCGTLGAAILVAVAAGTWHEVRRCYAEEAASTIRLRVPTKDAAPLKYKKGETSDQVGAARLLVYLVIGETSAAGFRPVHADVSEARWPDDRGRSFERRFKSGESRCEWRFQIHDLRLRAFGTGEDAKLVSSGTTHFAMRRSGGSSSTGVGLEVGRVQSLNHMIWHSGLQNPLSIAGGIRQTQYVTSYYLVTRVAEDDPLKEVSLAEFVKPHEEAMYQSAGGRISSIAGAHSRGVEDFPVRGFALAGHIGASSLLLLAAAVLLTQLFIRRNLAFAGVLAAVVLYVAVLDRIVLGAHLGRLADPKAALPTRLVACRQSAGSFFYQRTALREIDTIAKDAAAPAELRQSARQVAGELRDRQPAEKE